MDQCQWDMIYETALQKKHCKVTHTLLVMEWVMIDETSWQHHSLTIDHEWDMMDEIAWQVQKIQYCSLAVPVGQGMEYMAEETAWQRNHCSVTYPLLVMEWVMIHQMAWQRTQ